MAPSGGMALNEALCRLLEYVSDSVISLNILWPALIDPLRLFVILLWRRKKM